MKKLRIFALGSLATTLLTVMAIVGSASAGGMTAKTGILTCHVASGFGRLIASSRTVECHYSPFSGTPEDYSGTISRIGLDFGYLAPVGLAWAVLAPSSVPSNGALQGNYYGASAEISLLVGAGVNVMTGGFQKSIALQPISLQGDWGLYVGAGFASMSLQLQNSQPAVRSLPDGDGYTE